MERMIERIKNIILGSSLYVFQRPRQWESKAACLFQIDTGGDFQVPH